MKLVFAVAAVLVLLGVGISVGCGNSQVDNETVGYVKHVVNQHPIFCGNFTATVIDLKTPGVMTAEKVSFEVPSKKHANLLRQANQTRRQVKIVSNERRFILCGLEDYITDVSFLDETPPSTETAEVTH